MDEWVGGWVGGVPYVSLYASVVSVCAQKEKNLLKFNDSRVNVDKKIATECTARANNTGCTQKMGGEGSVCNKTCKSKLAFLSTLQECITIGRQENERKSMQKLQEPF